MKGPIVIWGVFAATTLASTSQAAHLFVSATASDIVKIDGDQYSYFATGQAFPDGLVFDASGNLYVANAGSGEIHKFTPNGTSSLVATVFPEPFCLAFDVSGYLYVSNSNSEISRISPTGDVSLFVTLPAYAEALVFDNDGNLYAPEVATGRIDKISPSGAVSLFATVPILPGAAAFDSHGNLFVSVFPRFAADQAVVEVTPSGNVSTFVTLRGADGLAFDTAGILYVASNDLNSIMEYAPDGSLVGSIDVPLDPRYLAFDSVPEPTSATLLLLGVLGCGWRRRGRLG